MHIRPMMRSDIPEACDIALEAFRDDNVYNWIFPGVRDPRLKTSARRVYLHRFHVRFSKPDHHGLVCVERCTDDPREETILGYAWFYRVGPASSATQQAYTGNASTFAGWFERAIHIPLLEWWESHVAPNPVTNYERMDRWLTSIAEQKWSKAIPARWELTVLAVGAAHQGKGVGRMLMDWGLEKARQEGVPVTLDATIMGRPVYAKCGFRGVDWLKLKVDQGWQDGCCMVYDPPGKYVRDLRPGERNYVEFEGGQRRDIDATWTEEALAIRKAKDDGTFPL